MSPSTQAETDVIARTTTWLERAVIGLNLCPFAKAVHVKGQIRYAVCASDQAADLLDALKLELKTLISADPVSIDTTLLIAPNCLPDFIDFNAFLAQADRVVRKAGLEGVIQIAPFHPRFEFADAPPDDISHSTNRAPYPILHLLREASIDRAVAAFAEPEAIYEANRRALERLGHSGWAALGLMPAA